MGDRKTKITFLEIFNVLKMQSTHIHLRVVILDPPPLHYFFGEFAVVSRALHEEVPPFFLIAIRLRSLHEKIIFSLAVHISAPQDTV